MKNTTREKGKASVQQRNNILWVSDLIKVRDNRKDGRRLLYSNLTDSQFKFEFTPKSLDDNEIEIITEFESDEERSIIQVPTKMSLNVIK